MQRDGNAAIRPDRQIFGRWCSAVYGVQVPRMLLAPSSGPDGAELISTDLDDVLQLVDWTMATTGQMDEDQVDMGVFLLSNVLPATKPSDFGALTKGKLRDMIKIQHDRMWRQNPSRLSMLQENLSNIMPIAL